MAGELNYDPGVIERAAGRLYEKASSVLIGSMVSGGCIGAAFGAVPLTSLGESWPIPSTFGFATMLVGAVVGAAVGYVIGDARAFGYRLQAQSTLSQLQLERNTAVAAQALAALVQQRAPRAAAAPQAAQPAQRPAAPPAQRPAARPAPAAAPPAAPPSIQPPVSV